MVRLLSTLLILAVLAFAVGFHNVRYFVDMPSLILVFGLTHLVIIATSGLSGLKTLYIFWLLGASDGQANVTQIGKIGCLASLGSGGAGCLIGMILMLQNLSDPSALGSGMAVTALSGLYGMLAALIIFVPMCFSGMNPPSTEAGNSTVIVATTLGFIAIPFFLMGKTFLLLDLAIRHF